MRRFALAAAVAAITLAAGSPARAQSISDLTFELQNQQTRIAAGDNVAYATLPARIAAIGAAIAAAKPDVWKSKRETDAAVIYLLSGGRPRDIVRLLESGAVPTSETPLMRGALAYALGAQDEAVKRLGSLDPLRLGLRLAAPIAFAQSVLQTKRDPKKAIALLDLARLLAPGTLIEEASLRREAMLASDEHDIDRVALLSRQYATRFGASVYADGFLRSLAGALAQTGTLDSPAKFDKFTAFFAALAPDRRRRFLLLVAHTAVLDGKFDVAAAATSEALRAVAPGSADEARLKLYQGMARILTSDYDSGLAELQSVVVARLDHHDQALLASARSIATFLRKPEAQVIERPTLAKSSATAKEDDPATKTIALAEATLSSTASLIDPMSADAASAPAGASSSLFQSDKGSQ